MGTCTKTDLRAKISTELTEKNIPLKAVNKTVSDFNEFYKYKGSTSFKEFSDEKLISTEEVNVSEGLADKLLLAAQKDMQDGTIIADPDYLNTYQDTVESIEDFFKKYDPDYKVKLNTFSSDDITFGSYSTRRFSTNNDSINLALSKTSRVSTTSEVFLHETLHSAMRGVLSFDGRLRTRINTIKSNVRDVLLANNITGEQLFLQGIDNPTDIEIQTANENFSYIMSEHRDPEEFFAYLISNSRVYATLKNLPSERMEAGNVIVDLFKRVLNLVLSRLGVEASETKEKDSTVAVEATKIMNDVLIARTKMVGRERKDFALTHIDKPMVHSLAVFTKPHVDTILNRLEPVIKNKFTKKTRELLYTQSDKIYTKIKSSKSLNDISDIIMDIDMFRNIINSETLQDIYYQIFKAESLSISKATSRLLKQSELVNEEAMLMKETAHKELNKRFGNKKNIRKLDLAINEIIGSGLNSRFGTMVADDFKEDSIKSDLDFFRKELEKMGLSTEELKSLSYLADFVHTGVPVVKHQPINIENILKGLTFESKAVNKLRDNPSKGMYDLATDYVSTLILNKKDSSTLTELQNLLADTETLNYLKRHNAEEATYREHVGYGISNIKFGKSLNYSSKVNTSVRVGTRKEAKAVGATMVSSDPLITIGGVDLFKYTIPDYTPNLDAGAVTDISLDIEGIKLSNMVLKSIKHKKRFSSKDLDSSKVSLATDTIIGNFDKYFGEDKLRDLFVPMYSNTGKIIDYVLPYSDSDIVDLLGYKPDLLKESSEISYQLSRISKANEYKANLINAIAEDNIPETKDTVKLRNLNVSLNIPSEFMDLNVPKDLVPYFTGVKRASLSEVDIVKRFPSLHNILGIAEKAIEEIGSTFKQATVLLTPAIFLGNLASNSKVLAEEGLSPTMLTERFPEELEQVTYFYKLLDNNATLELRLKSGEDVSDEYIANREQLESSPYFILYSYGHLNKSSDDNNILNDSKLLPDIKDKLLGKDIENLDISIYQKAKELSMENNKPIEDNMSRAKRLVKKSTLGRNPKLSKAVHSFVNNLYANNGSSVNNIASTLLVTSDAITKKLLLDFKANQENDLDIPSYMNELSDKFVDYQRPQSSLGQYAEKVGLVLFTKFLFRHLKGYATTFRRNKDAVLATHAFEQLTGIDLTSPEDSWQGGDVAKALSDRTKIFELDTVLEENMIPHTSHLFTSVNNIVWS